MADFADEAAEAQALELQLAFASRKRSRLQPCGTCHFCEDEVSAVQLFCNHECAEDFERLEKAAARSGTPARAAAGREARA